MGHHDDAVPFLEGRGLIQGLFLASCVLSVVSWYTTWQGMALYLNGWFAFLAALGVQSALVLVAWLGARATTGRATLRLVYVMTALVSVAFSYASLHTWFLARERPAQVQRGLHDQLQAAGGAALRQVADGIAEGQRHAAALEALARQEAELGHASAALDPDPVIQAARQAVAQEAVGREGAGRGGRHAAFLRHARLAQDGVSRLQAAAQRLTDARSRLRPGDPSEQQLRTMRDAFDAVPWGELERVLHGPSFQPPVLPALAAHLDQAATGQEALMDAFRTLLGAPTAEAWAALLLAAFIDLLVFLMAHASGPHMAGSPEQRWVRLAARMEGEDPQVFLRGILRRMAPQGQDLAFVSEEGLRPGERQFLLLLAAHGKAFHRREPGGFVVEAEVAAALMEGLARPGVVMRATPAAAL